MHCAGQFVQGKKFSILSTCVYAMPSCNCSAALQCQYTGHVPMISVELEFVLCKLCCMYCSCTVSMHTVLFYSACWKCRKMGDLSTAGTTACTVMFRMGQIFVSNCGDSTVVMGIRNLAYCQPDKRPLIASVFTKDHRPHCRHPVEKRKNCW